MVCVYGTKYGHDPRQLRPPESAAPLLLASLLPAALWDLPRRNIFSTPRAAAYRGVVVAQPPLEPSQRACTSLCMHSPTSLGRLSPHPRPGVRVASSSDSWRAATDTRVPPSVEPITVGRAGICRHIESQGQAARALRCSRALSRAGCLLAFAASLRSRRSSGGSGTAFLLCAPDAPCG